jgi:hypothetical protein
MWPDAARRSWSCTSCSTRLGRACRIPASASARRSRSGTAVRTRWGSVSEGSGDQVSGAGGQPGQGRSRAAGVVRLDGPDLIDRSKQFCTGQSEADPSPPMHGRPAANAFASLQPVRSVWLAWTGWAYRSMTAHTASSTPTPVSIGKVTFQYRITHGITLEGRAGGCTPARPASERRGNGRL